VPTIPEYRKKHYRSIYELLNENPRIYEKTVAKKLEIDRNTTSKRMKEAFELGFISWPQIRKRSFRNLLEYIYLINCKNPARWFRKYIQDEDVTYHAVMNGFANLFIVTRKEIDIKDDAIVFGPRSDYHVAYAPNHTWKTSIQIMREKVAHFDPEEYEPKGILKNHWNKIVEWSPQFELLYQYYKRNMRKKVTPAMKKYHISGEKTYEWLKNVKKYCTVFVRYFPEGFSSYDPYLFMFETDYEDFVIDLFSEIPTSPFFYKVSNKLFLFANVDRRLVKVTDTENEVPDISKLHIPLLIEDLLEKGIITSEAHAASEYYWIKDL